MLLAYVFRVVSLRSDDSIVSGFAVKKDILPEVVVERAITSWKENVKQTTVEEGVQGNPQPSRTGSWQPT